MTVSQARSISTNQVNVHDDLRKVVAKHKANDFKRPIAAHTAAAFTTMLNFLGSWKGDIIIDAGCGVGESTINIAAEYPHAMVIGVDKSEARLDKHQSYADTHRHGLAKASSQSEKTSNYLLLQADLNDFWRLLANHIDANKPAWNVAKQFILYPNPYPKKTQLGKRWHGSALFPTILNISANIEVRSNWRLYLDEFLIAAQCYGLSGIVSIIANDTTSSPYTPFERKYINSDQACFKLVIRPSGCDKK